MMLGFWRGSNLYSITFLTVLQIIEIGSLAEKGSSSDMILPAIQCLLQLDSSSEASTCNTVMSPRIADRGRTFRPLAKVPMLSDLCQSCQCFPHEPHEIARQWFG